MNSRGIRLGLAFVIAFAGTTATNLVVFAQQPKRPEPSSSQMSGMPGMSEEMNKRGDHVMGFDHTKTTHHFRLLENGGAIEVTANSGADAESRDQIRMHLRHIAKMFAGGNFNAPMSVHEQTPPGVPTMKRLASEIEYQFEETERGGIVHITTKSGEALQAIYEFLKFQIKEHQTGDLLEVQPSLVRPGL